MREKFSSTHEMCDFQSHFIATEFFKCSMNEFREIIKEFLYYN